MMGAARRRPRVKICGITRLEDARLAVDLGADALGFVFWPSSPRYIDPARASAIAHALPAFVTTVGVFVNQPLEVIADVASRVRLGAVQLHGSESPAFCADVGRPLIKAIAVPDADDGQVLDIATRYPDATVLLDAHDPVQVGGTGRTIDWRVAERVARARPIILSGGLAPHNIAAAITMVRPYAVDVSSGVEDAPGMKAPARVRALFRALEGLPGSSVRNETGDA